MNHRVFESNGIAILNAFLTKRNKRNNIKRNIKDIGTVTAAGMLSITGTNSDIPILLCGKRERTFPIIQQIVKRITKPFVLIGTKRDIPSSSCFYLLNVEWENNFPQRVLPGGNGLLILDPGAQTFLSLKDCLLSWDTHYVVLCLGNGLRLDGEMLDLLNGIGQYTLVTDGLQRSVRNTEYNNLSVQHIISSMDCIIATSTGSFAEELISTLPKYEFEKVNNHMDISIHRNMQPNHNSSPSLHNGGAFRFGQSRSIENRSILSQDDLRELQRTNRMLIHNNRTALTWVAQIVG